MHRDGSKTWFVDHGILRFVCSTRKAADALVAILRAGGLLEVSIKPVHPASPAPSMLEQIG